MPVESAARLKPVMDANVMGLTPILPVMTDVGTFVMPVLVRMTKFSAVPKLTADSAAAVANTESANMMDLILKSIDII